MNKHTLSIPEYVILTISFGVWGGITIKEDKLPDTFNMNHVKIWERRLPRKNRMRIRQLLFQNNLPALPAVKDRRGEWAFTLIEMLVVIAIIGILSTMLMPALMEAIDSAATISCVNNQKQLAFGIGMYVEDNDSEMLRKWDCNPYGTLYWGTFISGNQGTGAIKAYADGSEYVPKGPTFLCPKTPKYSAYAKNGGSGGWATEYTAYGMYQVSNEIYVNKPYWTFVKTWKPQGSSTRPFISTFMMNRVKDSGNLALLSDTITATTGARTNSPSSTFIPSYDVSYTPRIHLLHGNNQANILFFDYHAKTMDMFDINATRAHPKYFWYKDNSTGFNF